MNFYLKVLPNDITKHYSYNYYSISFQDSVLGAYLDQLGVQSDEAHAVRAMLGCSEIRNTAQYLSAGEGTSSAANSKTGLL